MVVKFIIYKMHWIKLLKKKRKDCFPEMVAMVATEKQW